jgi:hypothetical protein
MAGGTVSEGDRAPSQGGVIEGSNPTEYNPKDPIIIFIIQVCSTQHPEISLAHGAVLTLPPSQRHPSF